MSRIRWAKTRSAELITALTQTPRDSAREIIGDTFEQEELDSEQLTAFAAATPAQVAALLAGGGFGQYAVALGHLSCAEALLQTEESLRAQGVAKGHARPLLELLSRQK